MNNKVRYETIHTELCILLNSSYMEDNNCRTKHDVTFLAKWLMDSPKWTSYRVNTIVSDCNQIIEEIKDTLEKQRLQLRLKEIPEIRTIFDDAIVIGPWKKYEFCGRDLKEVIVDAICGVAVLRGASIFAPGVKAMSTGLKVGEKVGIFADILSECKKGLKTELISESKVFVGDGIVRMTRNQIFKIEKPSGIAVETIMPASMVPVIGQSLGVPGSCLLQNLPSIICSKVLDPQPGEVVLDMCAAPGNKTTHIAELMKNEGILIALDKVKSKIPIIEENCRKHSITIVKAFAYDSTKCIKNDLDNSITDLNKGPPFSKEMFDRVLLDAPCSALGQRPFLRNQMTPKMINSYVPLQRKLFRVAVELLKPGGRLVYSTCTVRPEENEHLAAWALKSIPHIKLTSAVPLLGGQGWADCHLTDEQRYMVQRFSPSDDGTKKTESIYNDTIGFFIASFIKET